MEELYKQLATIKTYKVESIIEDKEQKILKFNYTSLVIDTEVIGFIDKTGIYLEIDMSNILTLHSDFLKIMSIMPDLEEIFKSKYSSIRLVGGTMYASTQDNIDDLLKFVDDCLYYTVMIMLPKYSNIPRFGPSPCIYAGITIRDKEYTYSNQYVSSNGLMSVRLGEEYLIYSTVRGLARGKGIYRDKYVKLGKVDKTSFENFFELNTNMLVALKNIGKLKLTKYHTLEMCDDNIVKVILTHSDKEIELGKIEGNEFILKGTHKQAFKFSILVILY